MKITVITQTYCEYCTKVIELLKETPMTLVDSEGQGGTQLRRFMKAQGITTVPAVFVDGQYIGGYNEAKEWKEKLPKI